MDEKKLFYHHSVKKLKRFTKREAKPETLSRIYHSIANLKKKEKIDDERLNYDTEVYEKTTNDYEVLT